MKLKPPVFVVGSPRSGTTWLYHILLSAGGFAIYRSEPKVFTYLAPLFGGFRSARHREGFLEKWLPSEEFVRSGLDAEYFRTRVLNECASPGDCQRILMDGMASQQGAQRWSDCTPDNLLVMERIRKAFPEALFVHMVRDGRDVALSMARQRWIRPLPWHRTRQWLPAALYWDWTVGRGREAGRRLGACYLEIRYEDLVRQPRPTLSALSTFIGQELDYERIQRRAIGSVSLPNSSFATATPSEKFQPVNRWESACSSADLGLMESLIGRRLHELGYELQTSPSPRRARMSEAVNRRFYQSRFAARFRLKACAPLGAWFADSSLLTSATPNVGADKTLRPGLYPEFTRWCVSGEAGGSFPNN